jgi:hypothetical protein
MLALCHQINTRTLERGPILELYLLDGPRERAIEGKDAAQNALDKYKEETMVEWMKKKKGAEVLKGDEAQLLEVEEVETEEGIE